MTKKNVNEYLFFEFEVDGDESSISDDWPFQLHYVGALQLPGELVEFFEFSDEGTEYYAQEGFYFSKAGMTMEDLYLQEVGEQWISEQQPVDLNTVVLGDDQIPKLSDRRRNIEAIAKEALGNIDAYTIGKGLYLQKTGSYLALLEVGSYENAVIIGTKLGPMTVGFPNASVHRRLAYGIGKYIQGSDIVVNVRKITSTI